MIKKFLYAFALFAVTSTTHVCANNLNMTLECHELVMLAPNEGTHTRTQNSVTIYTEEGHYKGTFSIYLHHGKKYISFNNTWICIQGKSRFGYNGNWYIIK